MPAVVILDNSLLRTRRPPVGWPSGPPTAVLTMEVLYRRSSSAWVRCSRASPGGMRAAMTTLRGRLALAVAVAALAGLALAPGGHAATPEPERPVSTLTPTATAKPW